MKAHAAPSELTNERDAFALMRECAFIAGDWVDGARRHDVENPASGEVIGSVPLLDAAHVDAAVAAARHAFPAWRNLLPRARADLLMRDRKSVV